MTPAIEKALSYLARFPRTERQLSAYLKRKGFSSEEIAEAVVYLRERSLLNDTAFAESYIQSRIRRGDGPLKIKQLLFQKGISPAEADAMLKNLYPVEAQIERIHELMLQKSRLEKERLLRFLASRGFSRYVIIQAFRERP